MGKTLACSVHSPEPHPTGRSVGRTPRHSLSSGRGPPQLHSKACCKWTTVVSSLVPSGRREKHKRRPKILAPILENSRQNYPSRQFSQEEQICLALSPPSWIALPTRKERYSLFLGTQKRGIHTKEVFLKAPQPNSNQPTILKKLPPKRQSCSFPVGRRTCTSSGPVPTQHQLPQPENPLADRSCQSPAPAPALVQRPGPTCLLGEGSRELWGPSPAGCRHSCSFHLSQSIPGPCGQPELQANPGAALPLPSS